VLESQGAAEVTEALVEHALALDGDGSSFEALSVELRLLGALNRRLRASFRKFAALRAHLKERTLRLARAGLTPARTAP
jgi:hypothetical protein